MTDQKFTLNVSGGALHDVAPAADELGRANGRSSPRRAPS